MKRIVMFGGGSGSRDITIALCQAGWDVTRIVPAWDSGGSSKALRESLGILALGDIRQALMTLAHGEGRLSNVVRYFNARLSEIPDRAALRAEFEFYVRGAHPMLRTMPPEVRRAIVDYLGVFESSIGPDFDLSRGSIGNFVLTGAYLAHQRDINRAVLVFRALCGIGGHVWPSTTDDEVELVADLRDGSQVRRQDQVTRLSGEQAAIGIERVRLHGAQGRPPEANPAALGALAQADLVVFGPGSFFTSTLGHLAVRGVAAALGAVPEVPKVYIGNILQCPETVDRSAADLLRAFGLGGGAGLLTHALVNRGWVPFERTERGHRYLSEGETLAQDGAGLHLFVDDFEDPWQRGRHDPQKVEMTLGHIADPSSEPTASAMMWL
ncbi:gluconeogenesis factor YvcK family protein [Leptothrix discophora]|uniref:YvcK family protein n=1 Tax=Leptothrix discophora TaxID=89 RepID=A0ABT9G3R6_LEPDI|nr:gluconeogenesis factor YvcK family protein [Leptothrix discophora]MDP4301065.1 YvcK family protein [Leptothrix discophora]